MKEQKEDNIWPCAYGTGLGENIPYNPPNKPDVPQPTFGEWQLCPKCLGEGIIPAGSTSTSYFKTCDVCNGAKILMKPIINL